jgi:endonuclease/exonuclease/phosphatase family metal-dependent hydrolase
VIHVLVNHFKSQSGGGGPKRKRQAKAVRKIVDELVQTGAHVVVGDLNEGPVIAGSQASNLARLFKSNSPLIYCYSWPGFAIGNSPGTCDSCVLRNRLDYIFISKSLQPYYTGGRVFRKGLWGSRTKRPTLWETYPEITASKEGASDHSAVVIELNL